MAKQPAHHKLDVYGADLYLATDSKQWKRLRKTLDFIDKDVPESLGMSHFAVWVPNKPGPHVPTIVFWIEAAAIKTLPELVDTLAHEAAHGCAQLFDHIGHEIKGSDEPSAYLIGWIAGWLMKHTPYPST